MRRRTFEATSASTLQKLMMMMQFFKLQRLFKFLHFKFYRILDNFNFCYFFYVKYGPIFGRFVVFVVFHSH